MTEVVEETEPESSFKDTDRKKKINLRRNKSDVPEAVPEETTYEDREDDFSDSSEDDTVKKAKNELKDFTFIPGKNVDDNKGHTFMAKTLSDVDYSKLSSIEKIKEYLEAELGPNLFMKIYPIIRSLGDDILL